MDEQPHLCSSLQLRAPPGSPDHLSLCPGRQRGRTTPPLTPKHLPGCLRCPARARQGPGWRQRRAAHATRAPPAARYGNKEPGRGRLLWRWRALRSSCQRDYRATFYGNEAAFKIGLEGSCLGNLDRFFRGGCDFPR